MMADQQMEIPKIFRCSETSCEPALADEGVTSYLSGFFIRSDQEGLAIDPMR